MAFFLTLAALASLLAPASIRDRIQVAVTDLVVPGQAGFHRAVTSLHSHWQQADSSSELEMEQQRLFKQLAATQRRVRQLEVANAELSEQIEVARSQGPQLYRTSPSQPLVVPQLLQARVVGRELGSTAIAKLLLSLGTEHGAAESAWVVESSDTLIDQGENDDVAVGQAVYSGATIVGRVTHVGRWVSAIQHVTDPDYRGRARVLRRVGERLRAGAEGRIAGTGTHLCRLEEIPATAAVAVGDEVYSGTGSAAVRYPLFYGTIVRAELEEGADTWTIDVEPALSIEQVQHVAVLRETLNPERILAN